MITPNHSNEEHYRMEMALRGQQIARLQRTIHRQRIHIRSLKAQVDLVAEWREDLTHHQQLLMQAKQQIEKLMTHNRELKDRNSTLEIIHATIVGDQQ